MNRDKVEIEKLFKEVQQEISENIRQLMEQLWLKWSHLGVDVDTKVKNITKLVQIEKDLHRDVITETEQKLKNLQDEINKLKVEREELKRNLPDDITMLDIKEDSFLMTLKEELQNIIAECKQQIEQRRVCMMRLLEWQKDLADKLDVTIDELQNVTLSPIPSEEELKRFEEYLTVLQSERDKRAALYLKTQIEVRDIVDKLQYKPQNKFENMVITLLSSQFKVSDLNMDRLAKFQQDLQEKYQQTNNRVLELRERLTKLWDCLEEDHIYRENFLQAHPGCSQHSENAIKEEIKRCEQIKKQKIQVFVANIRTKIKLMWDNIMYSTQEREEFVHYYQDIFTEDTLTLHELYLEKITKFYNDHRNIFEMVATRKNLWLKMTELEGRATEPGRYHNRGGQLLKEEKERKAIASNLPKIEAQIKDLVMEYEARTGNTFNVDGKPLLQFIEEEWEIRKAERHNKLSARKQALTPTTPLLRSIATSPLGKRNRTAAGLAATSERNGLPVKRQLITSSATKAMSPVSSNVSAFKRTAATSAKRRISGRLAARAAADGKGDNAKRKLDYGGELKKIPKLTFNGSILKHKRKSYGRRSGGRRSISKTQPTTNGPQENEKDLTEKDATQKDPLMETTMLTTYTDFKDCINEKQISRSSMATKVHEMNNASAVLCEPVMEKNNPEVVQKKTTCNKIPGTPLRLGKENINSTQYMCQMTPQKSVLCTPNKLTRSALKLNNEAFATPRTPLSANKVNLQRQNTVTSMPLKTTPINVSRSKTSSTLVRAKNLPPLM